MVDLRHPVQTLQWALMQAVERDLDGMESPIANDLLRGSGSACTPLTCRPRSDQCGVVMFEQTWHATDLGMDRGSRAGEDVEAETVIVTGPAGDACVYVAMQLLYHIKTPNRRFFLDVAAQQLRGKGTHALYEGRDTSDLEAFDFEAAAALARLRGALKHAQAGEGESVARVLHAFADELIHTDAGNVHAQANAQAGCRRAAP